MTAKLVTLIIAVLVISLVNERCEGGPILSLLGTASTFTDLYGFTEGMLEKILEQPPSADEVLLAVQSMNREVREDLEEISKSLKDMPSIIDHVTKRNKLQEHVNHIGFVFENAVYKQKNIKLNRRDHESVYETFRANYETDLDEDISEIHRMMVDDVTTNFLTKDFANGLKIFENVCETRMSHLQLLESILTKLKVATAQYYVAKMMIYDFVEVYEKDPHAYDQTRVNLHNKVQADYSTVVRKFKAIMATASREIWRCDGPETPRYQNEAGSAYFELMAFSKYIFNEGVRASSWGVCEHSPRCPQIDRVNDCGKYDPGNLCRNTRKCSSRLLDVGNYHPDHETLSYICVNSDSAAPNRYRAIVPENNVDTLSCQNGNREFIRDVQHGGGGGMFGFTPISHCSYCQSICQENFYSINTAPVFADTANNKIVTGVRLVVEDKTFFIQIQQGTLLPNATVDPNSVEWKPIDPNAKNHYAPQIHWEDHRSIDLTTVELPKGQLVSGLAFNLKRFNSISNIPRFRLVTYPCAFDFKEGKLATTCNALPISSPSSQDARDEFQLEDADVPTHASRNDPISKNGQFVRFTVTSMRKDGGQTTIPFVDIQELVTKPPMPLSGAGLFLRGQAGFGGFLALKVLTYNIVDYIPEKAEKQGLIPIQ